MSVDAVTAAPTSLVPSTADRASDIPCLRRRAIDSSTTMELSTSMPMPSVRPPSDIRLSEMSSSYRRMNVASTESGIDSAMMSVERTWRRNRKSTITASRPPISAALRTSSIAFAMNTDWSKRTSRCIPSGSLPFSHSARRSCSAR